MTNAICQHVTWSKGHEQVLLCDISLDPHHQFCKVAGFIHLIDEEIEAQGKMRLQNWWSQNKHLEPRDCKLLPSHSPFLPQHNLREKMGIPQLSQRGHLPEPEKHWCAVLHSSYYLELPVFLCVSPSSLLFYFPLILYSTLFTFPAKTNTGIFKLCIAKAVFWHTEEIYTYIYIIFFP